jgi:fluoride exporter
MLIVAIGGFIGTISRYILGVLMMKWMPHPPIPVAMLLVNCLGSFGLGLFTSHYTNMNGDPSLVLLGGVGFFGAFTTFSTFSMEAYDLIKSRKWKKASLYICLTIFGSLFAFWLGFTLSFSIR